jgi:hypothetical protein
MCYRSNESRLHDNKENQLFNWVFSRQYANNDLKRVSGRLQTSEGRTRLRDSPEKKTDTTDRQNTAGQGIAMNNPGAGIQDSEDKVSSLSGARLCNKKL